MHYHSVLITSGIKEKTAYIFRVLCRFHNSFDPHKNLKSKWKAQRGKVTCPRSLCRWIKKLELIQARSAEYFSLHHSCLDSWVGEIELEEVGKRDPSLVTDDIK